MEYHLTEKKRVGAAMFLLAFAALFCTFPLFIRVSLPYGHDTVFHVFQAEQFERAIHEGVLYPRWVPDSNRGYGSANFIFYAPLTYYLVTAVYSVMPSLIVSMIVVIWCGFFLSGVSMFFATRGIFGKGGGLISAVIYQILPFHVIDLYLRGTFAELFAYVWFPVILLFLVRLFRTGHKSAFLGLSLSYAALILTHLVSGFIFSLVIGGFVLYHFIFVNRQTALKALLSICLGLGVSSLYLIPVIMEQKYVHIDYIVKSVVGDYRKSFLFMWDMLQLKMSHMKRKLFL